MIATDTIRNAPEPDLRRWLESARRDLLTAPPGRRSALIEYIAAIESELARQDPVRELPF